MLIIMPIKCLLSFLFLIPFTSIAEELINQFQEIYQQELGVFESCPSDDDKLVRLCSPALKNEGNAPYLLYHGEKTEKVMILLHGLSDSPYYFRSIAQSLFESGANVVVALLPGHGKIDADADMTDANLQQRWDKHIQQLMVFAESLGNERYLGGFSTGAAIATHYVLTHPKQASALMSFSGALALNADVESMAKLWGIKWLAKLMEGEYDEFGANPYKYAKVHGYAGMVLMDEILAIRELIEQGTELDIPLFIAHSVADKTTPIAGVQWLAEQNKGTTAEFILNEKDNVCHADVVIDQAQIDDMNFDQSKLSQPIEDCWIPKANPKHAEMLRSLHQFLAST